MAAEGKRQSEIARALHISTMTYHRWRKARSRLPDGSADEVVGETQRRGPRVPQHQNMRARKLEFENERLRRLVTDLLLEKIRLEEALQARRSKLEPARG